MKSRLETTILPLLFAAAVSSAAEPAAGRYAAPGPNRQAAALEEISFYDVWIRERLALGLSLSYSRLTDADRPKDESRTRTFVGYVNHLSNENEFGFVPTLTWLASDFVRVGLTWQNTEVRTLNFKKDPHLNRRLSDGNSTEKGPVLMVEGVWPLDEGRVRPHVGLGLGWFCGSFAEDTWWRLGYLSPVDWEAAGRPRSKPAENRYRAIRVDDEIGVLASVGVAWRPDPRWEIDFSIRKTWLDPDCEFGYEDAKTHKWDHQLGGHFSMDTIAAVLTVSWVF